MIKPIMYPGGAWRKSRHILAYYPDIYHKDNLEGVLTHVESFGGGCSTLLRLPDGQVPRHIAYNDLNGRLVNMMRQIRDNTDELADLIKCTVYHPEELTTAVNVHDDPVEDARRFYTLLHLARRPFDKFPSFVRQYKCATHKDKTGAMTMRSSRFDSVDHLWHVADRLLGASMDCMDGIEHMLKHDNDGAMHIIDPPFNRDARKNKALYEFEDGSDPEYEYRLLVAADSLIGRAIILGYNSPTHEAILNNWHRIDIKVNTDGKQHNECFWLNPRLTEEFNLGGAR